MRKTRLDYIKYTLRHKIAFIKTEKKLTGRVSLRGILHDLDKVFMYMVLNPNKTRGIHRKYSKHHIENCKTQKDFIQAVIDWECARFTKRDKSLNAYDFMIKYYKQYSPEILPILIRFGINKSKDRKYL